MKIFGMGGPGPISSRLVTESPDPGDADPASEIAADSAQSSEDGADGAQGHGQTALAASPGKRLDHAVAFATTEHFTLQTARALTVTESNGRAIMYLAALSSSLIALAFVGQMTNLDVEFHAFALILLPVVAFVGVVTFLRLVQSSIEDIAFGQRIALVRSFYLDVSPELDPYVVSAPGTNSAAIDEDWRKPSAWQLALTAAGMIAVVNSVVIATCAGLALVAATVESPAIAVAVGAIVGAGALVLHERCHRRAFDAYNPEAVDRAAIVIPHPPTREETAPP